MDRLARRDNARYSSRLLLTAQFTQHNFLLDCGRFLSYERRVIFPWHVSVRRLVKLMLYAEQHQHQQQR